MTENVNLKTRSMEARPMARITGNPLGPSASRFEVRAENTCRSSLSDSRNALQHGSTSPVPNIKFHVKHHPRIRGFHSFPQYPLFVQQHHPCAHDSFHTRAIITPADVAKAHCDCRHHEHSKAIHQRSTPTSSTPRASNRNQSEGRASGGQVSIPRASSRSRTTSDITHRTNYQNRRRPSSYRCFT